MEPSPAQIAVIGGGISGLAAALRLRERSPQAKVTLFEAGERLGGILGTTRRDGFLVERTADMFTTREPWALDLCRRLGLENQLVGTSTAQRRAYVVFRGKLVEVPEGFTLMSPAKVSAVLKTPLLSWRGKLRLAGEYFVPPRTTGDDESLASFAIRRFGREAFDRLIQPLVGGIYTADPNKLSLAATLPQFLAMERQAGSVIRATRQQHRRTRTQETSSGARYGQFMAPREGMQMLVDAIVARIPKESIRLGAAVERLTPQMDGTWQIQTREEMPEAFDGVVLATKATIAGRLLMMTSPALASDLAHIPYAGAALAVLGVRRDQIAHPLDGFGFVVPAVENRKILAGSFSSIKFAGRAPDDCVLIRVFVGGALQPELLERDDAELQKIVLDELRELIGLSGAPLWFELNRYTNAMPQYHVGHLQVVQAIEERAHALPNFALAGNAYRGVGVPFCIHSGEQAAERVLDSLAAMRRATPAAG